MCLSEWVEHARLQDVQSPCNKAVEPLCKGGPLGNQAPPGETHVGKSCISARPSPVRQFHSYCGGHVLEVTISSASMQNCFDSSHLLSPEQGHLPWLPWGCSAQLQPLQVMLLLLLRASKRPLPAAVSRHTERLHHSRPAGLSAQQHQPHGHQHSRAAVTPQYRAGNGQLHCMKSEICRTLIAGTRVGLHAAIRWIRGPCWLTLLLWTP